MDRGHKLSRYDPRVKKIVLVVWLTSNEENVLEEGRVEESKVEKWMGEILLRL